MNIVARLPLKHSSRRSTAWFKPVQHFLLKNGYYNAFSEMVKAAFMSLQKKGAAVKI